MIIQGKIIIKRLSNKVYTQLRKRKKLRKVYESIISLVRINEKDNLFKISNAKISNNLLFYIA